MNRRIICLAAALLLSSGCEVVHRVGGADSKELGGPPSHRLLTLVLYIAADNELESAAIDSINELESVDLTSSGITVLALLDRAPGYDTSNGDWTGSALYEVAIDQGGENGEIVSPRLAVEGLGLDPDSETELDMGDPATLSRLLDFAGSSYPADHTALVIWGHGSGWRSSGVATKPAALPPFRAVAFDDSSPSTPLYTSELAAALEGRSVDLIAFDTCSEAMIEVAHELRGHASWMVASEDLLASRGFDYRVVLRELSETKGEPEAVASAFVESFAESEAASAGATISALRLRSVDELMSSLNELSNSLWAGISDSELRAEVRRTLFEDVEGFYTVPGDLNLDLFDMAHVVADRFPWAAAAATRLASAVSETVAREWHHPTGHPNAGGIAVHYVPLAADGSAAVHDDAYFRGLPTAYPLAFVASSTWAPTYPLGPGLLYRLWYEAF